MNTLFYILKINFQSFADYNKISYAGHFYHAHMGKRFFFFLTRQLFVCNVILIHDKNLPNILFSRHKKASPFNEHFNTRYLFLSETLLCNMYSSRYVMKPVTAFTPLK